VREVSEMTEDDKCSSEDESCGGCSGCCGGDKTDEACMFNVAQRVEYAPNAVVSSTVTDSDAGTMTVFAFDAGQRLSTHSAPYDAHVYVLDGEARIVVGGEPYAVKTGEMIVMPADVPHSVEAEQRFKMLLVMFWAGD
jgi:quercetin dioxygenase-like cupin family protein